MSDLLNFTFLNYLINYYKWFNFYMQEYGHHVRLATHANFKTFIKSAGVDFYPLGGDPRILAGCKKSLSLINAFIHI